MNQNVIKIVVENDLCVGCGICSAICPANALKIKFNKNGEYNPVHISDCLKKCNLCTTVCPFSPNEENEDSIGKKIFGNIKDIKHQVETGYYLNSYVGYSIINDQRINGSSGGMATWLLETLLKEEIVDYVVCVKPNDDPEKLFRYAIFNDTESIRKSARSAYYPVELSEVFKHIIKTEGRYAITGLPCFIKSIRLAQKRDKSLNDRIITVGLTCGQLKSKHYTSYIASLTGIDEKLKHVNYRGKTKGLSSGNYCFHCTDQQDNQGSLLWSQGMGKIWTNRWFGLNCCNYCDDIFAELADVTLMDAWLPEHKEEWKGTNLVITRLPIFDKIIKSGIKRNQIKIDKISIHRVIQAQSAPLKVKRKYLSYKLYRAEQKKQVTPKKRVKPSNQLDLISKIEIQFKNKMQKLSKNLFSEYVKNNPKNNKIIEKKLKKYINGFRRIKKIYNILASFINHKK